MIKMPEIIYDPIWDGHSNLPTPLGILYHNDYGAMGPEEYKDWLRKMRVGTPTKGFANEYNNRHTIAQYIREGRAGWHAGDGLGIGNMRYYGIEIVESYDEIYVAVSDAEFIENENMSLRRGSELFHKWGLQPNRTTVRLHKEFADTSCPHRSWKLHGRSLESVQGYFIEKMKYYMSLGKTVEEIINAENAKLSSSAPVVKPTPKPVSNGIEKKYAETGRFYPDRTLQVYDKPSTSGKKLVQYHAKEYVDYHTVHLGNGHVWIQYTRAGGKGEGYIAIRTYINGRYGSSWGVIPDTVAIAKPVAKPAPKPAAPKPVAPTVIKKYAENGTFYPNDTIIVRSSPSVANDHNIVARYHAGEHVAYHTVVIADGYVWLQYKRSNGQQAYIPCRTYTNGKYGTLWGAIK